MDDKTQNSVNPVPVQPSPAQTPLPQGVNPTPKEEGNNKTVMFFIGGLVLVILIVVGGYLYLNNRQEKTSAPTPSPKAAVEENLEQDLDKVNVEDVEGEFKTLDQDLQNL